MRAVHALLGVGIAAGLAAALSSRRSAPISFKKRKSAAAALAHFTRVSVPYFSKKSGKTLSYQDVAQPLDDLVREASVNAGRIVAPEAFVLGTMIRSEVGSVKDVRARVGVAHAALNMARQQRKKILDLLAPKRVLGSQGFNGRGYAATLHAPTIIDVEAAEAALSGSVPDPTGGALHWDSPAAQRRGVAEGWAGYQGNTPEKIAADRIRDGMEEFTFETVNPDILRFWRPRKMTA